jgi:hypothetical protein
MECLDAARLAKRRKRHVLTGGRGIPLAVTLTGANVHDKWMVGATLDAALIYGSRGPRRPEHICLDKGYDYDDCEQTFPPPFPQSGSRSSRFRPRS